MTEHELQVIEEIMEMLEIKKYEKLQTLMPKLDTFLLFAIVQKLEEMNTKLIRILQEVD